MEPPGWRRTNGLLPRSWRGLTFLMSALPFFSIQTLTSFGPIPTNAQCRLPFSVEMQLLEGQRPAHVRPASQSRLPIPELMALSTRQAVELPRRYPGVIAACSKRCEEVLQLRLQLYHQAPAIRRKASQEISTLRRQPHALQYGKVPWIRPPRIKIRLRFDNL